MIKARHLVIGLLVAGIIGVGLMITTGSSRGKAEAIGCANAVTSMSLAARLWAEDHTGLCPTNFLSMSLELATPKILICPGDRDRQAVEDWESFTPAHCSYEILAPGLSVEDTDTAFLLCMIHGHLGYIHASNRYKERRVQVLQDACASLDPELTVFGIQSDIEEWWEVNAFHIAGPRIPSPPIPISDVQVLARLCRHTHSYVGKSRFEIEDGTIVGVSFAGADTRDATIDLLRDVPRLRELLGRLRRLSLKGTLVTDRSLRFLERELPHVEIAYSRLLEG